MRIKANDLYLKFINGRAGAFAGLVKLLTPRFFKLFRHLGADSSDAEDYCQEFFIAIYRAGGSFIKERDFMPWAYAIARNIYIKESQKKGRMKIIPLFDWIRTGGTDKNENYDISWLLSKLSVEKREVFELKHFGGLKFEEIAKILKIPAGTAKSRMYYALNDLKKILMEKIR